MARLREGLAVVAVVFFDILSSEHAQHERRSPSYALWAWKGGWGGGGSGEGGVSVLNYSVIEARPLLI